MAQVLKITTTPIETSIEVQKAQFKPSKDYISQNVSQRNAKLNINTRNIQVKLDTFEARKSMGYVSARGLMYNMSEAGQRAISEVTGRFAMEGNRMAQTFTGETIPDIVMSRVNPNLQMELTLMPSVPIDIDWEPAEINAEYVPGNLEINWETRRNEMEYIPGSIKMVINQYPKVNIEYIGKPIYAPPSADPEYTGEDK